MSTYVCPVCGREMLSLSMLCSGGFLDENHPPNVQPRLREATSWPAPGPGAAASDEKGVDV